MKRLIFALISCILLLTTSASSAQDNAIDVLRDANFAYESADYDGAIRLYRALVDNGFRSVEVYYNLGSAYFEQDDLGRAMLTFRRAYQLAPRDGDVNLGLALIRALRVDIQGDEVVLIDNLAAFTSGVISLTEFAWLTFGLWLTWFSLITLWLLRAALRRRLRFWLLMIGALLVVGGVLFGARLYAETVRPPAVVTALRTRAMSGPGESYLELFDIYAAAEVRILEARNGWARVILPDGTQAWLNGDALERV